MTIIEEKARAIAQQRRERKCGVRNTTGKQIEKAARALADLNTFALIVSILEGGHIYVSSSHTAAGRIVTICQREQKKLLKAYDAAVEKAGGGSYE